MSIDMSLAAKDPRTGKTAAIDADAFALPEAEKKERVESPIDWKDGDAGLALAREGKEKGIADALNQHFFDHPYAAVAKTPGCENPPEVALSAFTLPSLIASPAPTPEMPPSMPAPPPLPPGYIGELTFDNELKAAEQVVQNETRSS